MNATKEVLSWVEKDDHASLEAWLKGAPKIDLMLLHRLWSTATQGPLRSETLVVLFRYTHSHEVWGNTVSRHVAQAVVQNHPQVFAELLKKISEDCPTSSFQNGSPQEIRPNLSLQHAPPLEVVLNDVLVHLKNTPHAEHHIRKWLSDPAFKIHNLPRTVSSVLSIFAPLTLQNNAPLPQSSLHQAWVELTTSLTPVEMKNALRSLPSSPLLPHMQDALLHDLFAACFKKDDAWWSEMERLDRQSPQLSIDHPEWASVKERRHLLQTLRPDLSPSSPSGRKL